MDVLPVSDGSTRCATARRPRSSIGAMSVTRQRVLSSFVAFVLVVSAFALALALLGAGTI